MVTVYTLYQEGVDKKECETAEDIMDLDPGTYECQYDGNCFTKITISR